MMSLNQVQLIGNLGNDPDVRDARTGGVVTRFSVATSQQWTDKQTGEKREQTEWHRVVAFGKLAEIAASLLMKGTRVFVAGNLRTQKWTDQAGIERYTTEVVVSSFDGKLIALERRRPPAGAQEPYGPHYGAASAPAVAAAPPAPAPVDDSVPF